MNVQFTYPNGQLDTEIISDANILHVATPDQGERINRVQVVRVGQRYEQVEYWYDCNGNLTRVTSRQIDPPKSYGYTANNPAHVLKGGAK